MTFVDASSDSIIVITNYNYYLEQWLILLFQIMTIDKNQNCLSFMVFSIDIYIEFFNALNCFLIKLLREMNFFNNIR